jgi:hypothetical protein
VGISNGRSFGQARLGHGYFCVDSEQCLTGDVNGDKKTDIVLLKNWGAKRQALVATSNGQQFINTDPFAWKSDIDVGYPIGLADVNGDGKADLVMYEYPPAPRTGVTVVVYLTQKVPPPCPSGQARDPATGQCHPPVSGGFHQVLVYNCDPDQHQFYYWITDLTTGATSTRGPIDAMYSEWGFCPDPRDAPQTLSLTAGHTTELVVVDPQSIWLRRSK